MWLFRWPAPISKPGRNQGQGRTGALFCCGKLQAGGFWGINIMLCYLHTAEEQVFKEKLSFLPEHQTTHAAFPQETKLLHCLGKNRSSWVQAKELQRAVWSRKQLLLPCGLVKPEEGTGDARAGSCQKYHRYSTLSSGQLYKIPPQRFWELFCWVLGCRVNSQ